MVIMLIFSAAFLYSKILVGMVKRSMKNNSRNNNSSNNNNNRPCLSPWFWRRPSRGPARSCEEGRGPGQRQEGGQREGEGGQREGEGPREGEEEGPG
eukprot:4865462-Amphidinium_carterae.1